VSDWTSEYLTLIDDCEKRDTRLTDWEKQFIDSLGRQLASGRRPTPKQIETLENVWEKATARG
jgi:hypothetical protein